ncbi:MAG: COX15/CtaA family protein, partial [Kiloniellales bacterium]
YGILEPWYRNFFENVPAVQFNHRLLAMLTPLLAAALAILGATQTLSVTAWRALLLLLAMALVQVGLGIATLLLVVPVPLAAIHQAGALLLLSAALWSLHQLRPGGPVAPPRS